MDLSPLVERVRESNRQARDARGRWASHRARVMDVLRALTGAGERLALFGAGHLHDVELDELLLRFEQIALVDLDDEAVSHAVQRVAGAATQCVVHAPVDLTGALDLLDDVGRRPEGPARVLARLSYTSCRLPGEPFDVTVSLGALTQLMQAVPDAGVDAREVPRLSLAVRDKHLRDLVRLTKPGGTLVLVTDFVSTRSAPELVGLPEEALEPHLARLVAADNFFTGTNPYRLTEILEMQEPFRADIATARFVGPWLWHVTPDRQHLAGAIVAERRLRGRE